MRTIRLEDFWCKLCMLERLVNVSLIEAETMEAVVETCGVSEGGMWSLYHT